MNKKRIKEIIRNNFPNIPILKKIANNILINRYNINIVEQDKIEAIELNRKLKEDVVKKGDKVKPKLGNYVVKEYERLYREFDKLNIEYDDLILDLKFCIYSYGFTPTEYLVYDLKNKGYNERIKYISEKDHMVFIYKMNDVFDLQLFNDKMKTYEKFGKYYGREIISISSKKDYNKYIDFLENNPVFVKKQVYESCGNSISKVYSKDIDPKEYFSEILKNGKTILEECIEQHETLSNLNSSSVNTVRCITFNTKDEVVIGYTFMKIGRKGSFIDNGGAGGLLVGIDKNTGVFNTIAIDEKMNTYQNHPDNGTEFVGYKLPDWDKLMNLCIKLSQKASGVNCIGWDFTYTSKSEWVVVEGNGMTQFIGPQSTQGIGIRDEVISYMNDMELL